MNNEEYIRDVADEFNEIKETERIMKELFLVRQREVDSLLDRIRIEKEEKRETEIKNKLNYIIAMKKVTTTLPFIVIGRIKKCNMLLPTC